MKGKARVVLKWKQTLRIDSIDQGSSRWRGADILVFNTAHWWCRYKTKAGINYYQEGRIHSVQKSFGDLSIMGLINKSMHTKPTKVFFRSSAPSHFRGGQWNLGGSCKEATQPLQTSSSSYSEKNIILEVIKQMKTPVTFLNISGLSEYRIYGWDIHPYMEEKQGRREHSRLQSLVSSWHF